MNGEYVKQELAKMNQSELKDLGALVKFLAWRRNGGYVNPLVLLRGFKVHIYVRFCQLIGRV